MANHSYMTINGKKMGLISAGCSTQDSIGNKCQIGHTDQILVLALNHAMSTVSMNRPWFPRHSPSSRNSVSHTLLETAA